MRNKALFISLFVAVSGMTAPSASFAAPDRSAGLVLEAARPRPTLTDDDAFARREAQAKDLEKFEGCDIVIISTTAVLVVVLVLVLLIVF